MDRDLDLIMQFKDLNVVCEVTDYSVRLGMLKLTSGFLGDIGEIQKLDVALVDCMSSVNQSEDEEFRVDENGILKFKNRVCVCDVPELKKTTFEESHRRSLSIHPKVTKIYQDLKKTFWWSEMKRDVV
ncbi:uncharacterized protein LOC127082171 [Lathyrus oleraceus]|uniref:uncharacterized protein LOC127082171 n=1 Tax=Pisum sativum TaxID=3888 RepID=UPI0021D07414|nr:uncharacterized protein LOC127082171 [Pisum sativum]